MTDYWDTFCLASGRSCNFPLERLSEEKIKRAAIHGIFIRKAKGLRIKRGMERCYSVLREEVISYAKEQFYLAIKRGDILFSVSIKTGFSFDYEDLFKGFAENGICRYHSLDGFLYVVYREIDNDVKRREEAFSSSGMSKYVSSPPQLMGIGFPTYTSKKELIDHLDSIEDEAQELKSLIMCNLRIGQFDIVARIMDYLGLSSDIFKDKDISECRDVGIQAIRLYGDMRVIYRYKRKFRMNRKVLSKFDIGTNHKAVCI
jgi:hypothetical protein